MTSRILLFVGVLLMATHLSSGESLSSLIRVLQNNSVFAEPRSGRQMVQRFGSKVRLNSAPVRQAVGPVYSSAKLFSPQKITINRPFGAKKTSQKDSQQITGGPFLTPPVPIPGVSNPFGELDARPPSPVPIVSSPAPPPRPTIAPPTATSTLPPQPTSANNILVSDIRCLKSTSRDQLRATITSNRQLLAPPVFVLRPGVNPLTSSVCAMTSLSESQLSLNVNNLEACGVEACLQPNGETWLCLTLRFPVIAGIQLPEDDVVQIQCRPQDRSQSVDKQISVGASGLDQLIANAFVGDDQKFQCEVALFRQTPGSELFSTLVKPNDVIPLGEELHLRSIVRSGDGWEFSKLTDVSVHRVIGQGSGSDERVSVPLLLDDGCRNNAFQILAPKLPVHHKKTQLITNFPFRVFAFQGMNSGDRLEVTARVTGCVEAVDCVPSQCADGLGAGRRRRRRRSMFNQENNNNSSSQPGIKEWSTDMSFGVVLPTLTNRVVDSSSLERPLMGCPAPLLGSLLAAIASSTLLLGLLVYVCIVRRTKHLNKLNSTLEGSMTHSVIFGDNGSTTNHTLPARPEGGAVLGTPNSSAQSVLRCRRKRSFSADAASRRHKHVNIITVPALPQENLYSELDTSYSMQPTFV